MSYFGVRRGLGTVMTKCPDGYRLDAGVCNPTTPTPVQLADAIEAIAAQQLTADQAASLAWSLGRQQVVQPISEMSAAQLAAAVQLTAQVAAAQRVAQDLAAKEAAAALAAQQLAAQHTPAKPLPATIAPSASLAVPGRSGSTFGTNDSYTVTVTGSPNQPVTSTLNGSSPVVVGATDAAGRWSTSGNWLLSAGVYLSVYYVGGVFAGSFSFTVLDVSAAVSDPPACGSGYSRVSGVCVKDAPAADKPAGSSPAADLPAFLDFLPGGLKTSLSGSIGTVPVWLLAAGGAFYLFNRGKR